MSNRSESSANEDLLVRKIEELLQQIQFQEDPAEMDVLRRLYKKHVPIFRRSYFSALLLKQLAETVGVNTSSLSRSMPEKRKIRPEKPKKIRATTKNESSSDSRNTPASTEPAEGEDPNTLFISIGKNRRVFPRDLLGLFGTIDGLDTEKVGDIRILDNYSFVTIEAEIGPAIITALHNSEFRGRRLTVNFARKKS